MEESSSSGQHAPATSSAETLSGAGLDVAVARALGMHVYETDRGPRAGLLIWDRSTPILITEQYAHDGRWSPSTKWEIGGPIIERERIAISPRKGGSWQAECWRCPDGVRDFEGLPARQRGDTPLIAAMRAFVASRA